MKDFLDAFLENPSPKNSKYMNNEEAELRKVDVLF